MPIVNQDKRKKAIQEVKDLCKNPANVWVIHYSCENCACLKGSSPRIITIVVQKLSDGQTRSFSIHEEAELKGIQDITAEQYSKLEKSMLAKFYSFIERNNDRKFLHWNMRDGNYGFAALEHRFGVLGGEPEILSDDNKKDLARILLDIYGSEYIGHSRLQKLVEKNNIPSKDFLDAQAEANAFAEGRYVAIHQSTLRKMNVIAAIFERVNNNSLKTNTKYWELHGGKIVSFFSFFRENVYISGITTLWAFISIVIGIVIAVTKFFG